MIKLISILIGVLVCFGVNAIKPITICMSGKLELTLPVYKIAFLNAVKLALSHNMMTKQVQIKTYFFDNNPLSPVKAYKTMLQHHCAAIIGFEYLSDLLLIEKIQKDDTIPIFTTYASSNELDHIAKNIFMFMPKYDFQARKMLTFLQKNFHEIKKALIVTEIDRLDLFKYKIAYENLLTENKIHFDTMDFIGNDNHFIKKLIKFTKNKNYNFVFVFSGAVGSTKIINQMNNHTIKFIGTENFGSSTNQSLYVRLRDKNIVAYIIRNIDFLKSNNLLDRFTKDYVKKYGIMPSPLSAYVYDATMIILKTLENNNSITIKNILNTNYNGITGAYIKNNIFYRSSQYVILSIGKEGYQYEE